MASKPKLDLGLARTAHINWEYEMEAASRGGTITTASQSDDECALGRWLDGPGMDDYGGLEAIHPLKIAHEKFHLAARRMALIHENGGSRLRVAQELQTVREFSQEVIFHLTEIELESLEINHQMPPTRRPARAHFQRLFAGPFRALPEDHGILKISQARLIHLRWVKNLMTAFRHWGKGVSLESAELCSLGVWIHATGLSRFSGFSEMVQLDSAHKAFHEQAEKVLRALRNKQHRRAEDHYKHTLDLSREIVYLLSVIEYKINDSDAIQTTESFLDIPDTALDLDSELDRE
ncbi:MAG: CZB domain-containing protein [Magnetococcales bacterium]|nr:CZB domain-containing protein [Magnetococcales bacterium]